MNLTFYAMMYDGFSVVMIAQQGPPPTGRMIQLFAENTAPNVNVDGSGGHYAVVETGKQTAAGAFQPDPAVQNITLLASGTRTAITTAPAQVNTGYRGAILYLNITAASGTGGLTPILVATDPVSGASINVNTIGTAKTATGLYVYTIYPAASLNTGSGGLLATPLPVNWTVKISAGDGSSYTYSLSADLVP